MRTSDISRVTAETDIRLSLDLDGSGTSEIDTGVGFLDHMLTLFARHARFCILPMDEALILCAVDISGRDCLGYALDIPTEKVGTFDTELTEEFWLSFARNARVTLHLRQLAGSNSHHIIEGAFKAAARALRQAVSIDSAYADEVPSTKGLL